MYTEGFTGDIDGILARMAAQNNGAMMMELPRGVGRPDTFGLTKNQRDALTADLLTAARAMMCESVRRVTFQVDAQRKIVLSHWWQAANLYQQLTRNDFYAGLENKTGKPRIKRYQA